MELNLNILMCYFTDIVRRGCSKHWVSR